MLDNNTTELDNIINNINSESELDNFIKNIYKKSKNW